MKTINSKSTKADIYEAFQALKDRHTTMRQERDDLQKQVDQLTNLLKITQAHEKAVTKARNTSYPTPTIKSTDYVNIENSLNKTNRAHTQAEADRYYKIDKDQPTLNEKIDKAEAKENKQSKLPTAPQLRLFVARITHNNFGKDFKLQMPEAFTLATFQKLIAQLNDAPKTERPGKPTKPTAPNGHPDWDIYKADCAAYYNRRTKAICKLTVLYKEHADFIRDTFK